MATDADVRDGAPDGRLHRRRARHRDSGGHLRRGRAGGPGVPRRRLPAGPRSGAPQHHRRVGTGHQDERGGVLPHQHLPDVSGAQRVGGGALLQREGARPLLPRSAGGVVGERTPPRTIASGSTPQPFENVRYYAPCKPDGVNLNTLRTHPDLAANTEPLIWGLREVLEYAEVVLNRDDLDAKADAFIDFLADRVVGREFHAPELQPSQWRVLTFADLEAFFRAIFDSLENSNRGDVWRTHHIATIRKVRNRLGNITTRAKGLVTDDGTANDLPWGAFADRSVYVVDVAERRSAGAGSRLCPRGQQAPRAPRAPRPGRGPRGRLRGRTQQVRPGRRPRHLRAEDAARPLGARAGTSAWCSSPRSSSARRCSGGWSATRGRPSTAAWTPTNSPPPGMPRSRPPPRSSSPPCPRAN